MNMIARATAAGARQAWLLHNRSAFKKPVRRGRPQLLVDVSAIIQADAQTGIQRVVRAVWAELRRRDGDGFSVLPVHATDTKGYCYAPIEFLDGRANSSSANEPVKVQPGDKFLGLDLSAHLLPKYSRQARAWRRHGASIHVVVYDLLPLLRPEWFNRRTVSHFRRWFDFLAREADQALCISDEVARDLSRALAPTSEREGPALARLHMGGDIAASLPSSGISPEVLRLLDALRFRPAVLMVGTIEPRKGYDIALRTFEELWLSQPSEAPDLVIVGKAGWKTEALQKTIRKHPEHGKRLHWLDCVSDEGLCKLYEVCCGLFMASHAEGFGLPLIEAAMHRRAVLARDLPVFREQAVPDVLYFSDDQPKALGRKLIELTRAGRERTVPAADLPTWSECVDRLLTEIGLEPAIRPKAERVLRKAS
jgi:glycosyltransferase involved in cell wall biosynthesis